MIFLVWVRSFTYSYELIEGATNQGNPLLIVLLRKVYLQQKGLGEKEKPYVRENALGAAA